MRGYLVRRFILLIPTLFIVTIMVFLVVRFVPGNVIDMMAAEMSNLGEATTAEEIDIEWIRQKLGLDVPVHVQYGRWLGGIILHGDLGNSLLIAPGWNIPPWPATTVWLQCKVTSHRR